MSTDAWLLPEGIDELLPQAAQQLEDLRRELLDLYASWGYELVTPPFIEYLESLLSGTGNDLALQTFKLTDQHSGRMLGVRADMTPQVARIDAHRLRRATPTRLCYLGTVLRTRSDSFGRSRSPLQLGAELFGHDGIESDLEILLLMLATLNTAAVNQVHLDLGHVAIFRGLVRQAQLGAQQEALLFEQLQRKALPELHTQLNGINADSAAMLLALAELNGGLETLSTARQPLKTAPDEVHQALDSLEQLGRHISHRLPELPIHVDLAELGGYHYPTYHTGVVFAAYVPGLGQEIARGGRYDIGAQTLGRSRPATGFSTDLKTLLRLGQRNAIDATSTPNTVLAPAIAATIDTALEAKIDALRSAGQQVIRALADDPATHADADCRLVYDTNTGQWVVQSQASSIF